MSELNIKHKQHFGLLLAALILLTVIRLLPELQAPVRTFGYDYGFYLYALKTASLSLSSLIPGVIGGYGNPLFLLFKTVHLPPEASLNVSYFLLHLGLGLTFYWFYRDRNKTAGLYALLLFALSVPQSEAYLLFLYKSVIGVILMLAAFKFFIRKQYWPWLVVSIALLLFHRSTAIIYGITMLGYAVYFLALKRRFWLLGLFSLATVVSLAAINYYLHDSISAFLYNPNPALNEGIFLSGYNFFATTWLYSLLALSGLYFYIKQRQHPVVLIFTAVVVIWSIVKLPFYNRTFLFVDVALTLLAGYGLAQWRLHPIMRAVVTGVIVLIAGNQVVRFIQLQHQLISRQEIQEIVQTTTSHPGGFVLAVSANDAPWLLGYVQGSQLAAPGLFEDRHNYEEWQAFWAGQEQEKFLSLYSRPVLLYQRSYRMTGEINKCLQQLSPNFYSYACP